MICCDKSIFQLSDVNDHALEFKIICARKHVTLFEIGNKVRNDIKGD